MDWILWNESKRFEFFWYFDTFLEHKVFLQHECLHNWRSRKPQLKVQLFFLVTFIKVWQSLFCKNGPKFSRLSSKFTYLGSGWAAQHIRKALLQFLHVTIVVFTVNKANFITSWTSKEHLSNKKLCYTSYMLRYSSSH